MKRALAITLIVLLIVACLAGCGKSGSPEDKYVAKSIGGQTIQDMFQEMLDEFEGSYTMDELLDMLGLKSMDDFMVLELKSGGTAVMTSAMDEEQTTGTWKQNGSTVTITFEGDALDFTQKGNELSATIDGESYVFVKK